jgi:dihydrodipicolinate synthase/N-acetylneuraminate lyase
MTTLAPELAQLLQQGVVIPAHPLALTADCRVDIRHQRALTRYYCAAGVGGVAVGVHTTQFEIHAPEAGLLRPVLALAAATVDEALAAAPRPFIKIAGLVGPTRQACAEADLALELGYHAGLLSLAALRHADDDALIAHVTAVAARIPVMGFYLQPAVGGRILGYDFWRRMADIANVVAIKIAPFNRYQTLDVVRAVAAAGRGSSIALYTGNDDNILPDLITDFALAGEELPPLRIVGGLLGQWAVWTRRTVEMLAQIQAERAAGALNHAHWLRVGAQLTDANAAIFDVAGNFHGCIPGIHRILQRQGLMQGTHTLNPREALGPGQDAEIARVCAAYPHLTDDDFVAAHRAAWLE